jgi:hypothetical protein
LSQALNLWVMRGQMLEFASLPTTSTDRGTITKIDYGFCGAKPTRNPGGVTRRAALLAVSMEFSMEHLVSREIASWLSLPNSVLLDQKEPPGLTQLLLL